MALKFPKKNSAVSKVAPVDNDPELTKLKILIDNVGNTAPDAEKILAKIKKLEAELKPHKDACKELETHLMSMDRYGDDDEIHEKTEEFLLDAGVRGTSRSIRDIKEVYEMMGPETFFKVANVALKDIDAHLILPQREKVLETSRTKRTIKVIKNPLKR